MEQIEDIMVMNIPREGNADQLNINKNTKLTLRGKK